jgi:U6 snRNA-associated Sm-like protein LSm8
LCYSVNHVSRMATSTAQLLEPFSREGIVMVSTNDGRVLLGKLIGYDPQCNIVLAKCKERIFSTSEGVEIHDHGQYIIRGDNVATIGEIDTKLDDEIEWSEERAEPLKPIRH